MPGFVVTTETTMTCSHQGKVTITPSQQRAQVSGAPIATSMDAMLVAGCPAGTPTSPPCTKVTWNGLSARVRASGHPVLLQPLPPTGPVPGPGICAGPPPPTPLVAAVQLRVTGT